VQEGNLGLLRAEEKFDWRKGFKLIRPWRLLDRRHLVDPGAMSAQ
jgi:hypothetical protein